ncbi:unnamed protein product [Tilletia controversa]|nr:unnamed protein product [Tilletia controversa]CAD6917134.1 unnamed protein product [Tilletia controversa]CAD6925249.1 unnamed protein product [Tilletia controversa]CAD6927805.1 unnamed protein product [Tilletia controversa]
MSREATCSGLSVRDSSASTTGSRERWSVGLTLTLATSTALDAGEAIEDEGVEDAFEVMTEISDTARTARWTGECFMYTTASNRLQYLIALRCPCRW